ncbi:unnamed protein product [Pedinophyceae sp. YPF-701]|nr:unnamed protein product [Pedinophyceae sp. YPF-701]
MRAAAPCARARPVGGEVYIHARCRRSLTGRARVPGRQSRGAPSIDAGGAGAACGCRGVACGASKRKKTTDALEAMLGVEEPESGTQEETKKVEEKEATKTEMKSGAEKTTGQDGDPGRRRAKQISRKDLPPNMVPAEDWDLPLIPWQNPAGAVLVAQGLKGCAAVALLWLCGGRFPGLVHLDEEALRLALYAAGAIMLLDSVLLLPDWSPTDGKDAIVAPSPDAKFVKEELSNGLTILRPVKDAEEAEGGDGAEEGSASDGAEDREKQGDPNSVTIVSPPLASGLTDASPSTLQAGLWLYQRQRAAVMYDPATERPPEWALVGLGAAQGVAQAALLLATAVGPALLVQDFMENADDIPFKVQTLLSAVPGLPNDFLLDPGYFATVEQLRDAYSSVLADGKTYMYAIAPGKNGEIAPGYLTFAAVQVISSYIAVNALRIVKYVEAFRAPPRVLPGNLEKEMAQLEKRESGPDEPGITKKDIERVAAKQRAQESKGDDGTADAAAASAKATDLASKASPGGEGPATEVRGGLKPLPARKGRSSARRGAEVRGLLQKLARETARRMATFQLLRGARSIYGSVVLLTTAVVTHGNLGPALLGGGLSAAFSRLALQRCVDRVNDKRKAQEKAWIKAAVESRTAALEDQKAKTDRLAPSKGDASPKEGADGAGDRATQSDAENKAD